MADSVSGRKLAARNGMTVGRMAHTPLDERGHAIGLLQGHVAGGLADDGAARHRSSTALGVSMSPSRLGSVTAWPRSSSVAIARKRGAQVDADQLAGRNGHIPTNSNGIQDGASLASIVARGRWIMKERHWSRQDHDRESGTQGKVFMLTR